MQAAGRIIIKSPKDTVWRLRAIGDVHEFDAGCAVETFGEYVGQLADDPRGLAVLNGDLCDSIGIKDPRFDPGRPVGLTLRDFADLGRVVFGKMAERYHPVASKIIGAGMGNHEQVLLARTDSAGLWPWFVKELGTRDLGFCSLFDLVFQIGNREHTFRIATHHGAGWAVTAGGKLNRLRSFMDAFLADIVITGHTHEQLDHRVSALAASPGCDKLVSVQRLGIVNGTWLRTYTEGTTGYGEIRGYRPVALGNPIITIQPETRRLGVEW